MSGFSPNPSPIINTVSPGPTGSLAQNTAVWAPSGLSLIVICFVEVAGSAAWANARGKRRQESSAEILMV